MRISWRTPLLFWLTLLLSACTSPGTPPAFTPGGRLDQLRQSGQIQVGTAITRPFEYRDAATNALMGYDIDLMTRLVEPLGVTPVWHEMAFVDLLPELQAGHIEVVIAAMYITDEREAGVDFSQPYLQTGLVLVIRSDNRTIRSLEDLAGQVVGVKEGATGEQKAEALRQQSGIDLQIRRYTDTADSLEDLNQGRLDAVFNDRANAMLYIQTHPTLRILPGIIVPAGLGIAVRSGDTELLDFINRRLAQFDGDHTLNALFDRWINPETAHAVP